MYLPRLIELRLTIVFFCLELLYYNTCVDPAVFDHVRYVCFNYCMRSCVSSVNTSLLVSLHRQMKYKPMTNVVYAQSVLRCHVRSRHNQ